MNHSIPRMLIKYNQIIKKIKWNIILSGNFATKIKKLKSSKQKKKINI
jgi:hypothetical protein